jgi:hypothetical protein
MPPSAMTSVATVALAIETAQASRSAPTSIELQSASRACCTPATSGAIR